MFVAAFGQSAPSSPVRARAVGICVANAFMFGFLDVNVESSAVFVGMVSFCWARLSWLWSEFRHWTTFAALACLSLSFVWGTVHVSPPSGATILSPAFGAGIG